jgi:ArpU family phage transcriptional regulator
MLNKTENKTNEEKIEEMLKNYPLMKDKIELLEKITQKEYSLDSIDLTQPSGGQTNNINQEIEDFVTNIVGNKQILDDLVKLVICIEQGLKRLNKNERFIIKHKFFKDELTDYGIIGELGYSSRQSIYNNKEKAIGKIKNNSLYKHYDKFKKVIEEVN